MSFNLKFYGLIFLSAIVAVFGTRYVVPSGTDHLFTIAIIIVCLALFGRATYMGGQRQLLDDIRRKGSHTYTCGDPDLQELLNRSTHLQLLEIVDGQVNENAAWTLAEPLNRVQARLIPLAWRTNPKLRPTEEDLHAWVARRHESQADQFNAMREGACVFIRKLDAFMEGNPHDR